MWVCVVLKLLVSFVEIVSQESQGSDEEQDDCSDQKKGTFFQEEEVEDGDDYGDDSAD